MKKRKLPLFLCTVLILLMIVLPVSVYADPEETEETVQTEETAQPAEDGGSGSTEGSDDAVTGEVSPGIELQMSVASLTVTMQDNGRYLASWDIANAEGDLYVHLYMTQTKSEFEGAEIKSIRSGSKGSLSFEMPEVECGYYLFYIAAVSMDGGVAYGFSNDAVFLENGNSSGYLSGIKVGREKNDIYVIWDNNVSAQISVYDSETKALISKEIFQTQPAKVTVPDQYSNVLVGAAAVNDFSAGNFEPVVSLKNTRSSSEFKLPESTITSNSIYVIENTDDKSEVLLYCNGEKVQSVSGKFEVPLIEGENEVLAFVTDSSKRTIAMTEKITLDTVPPELVLSGGSTLIETEDGSVQITGNVEKGATLLCNGREVAVAGRSFCINRQVESGDTEFLLSASDTAGNETKITVTARKPALPEGTRNFLIVVVIVAVAAAVELYLYFSGRRRAKK